MTLLLTEMAKSLLLCSGQSGNDTEFRERAGGGDGGAPQAREVVTISSGDPFDHAEGKQPFQLSRERSRRGVGQQSHQIGAPQTVDIELRTLQCPQQLLLGALEEVQALDRPVALAPLVGQARKRALSGAVIVQRGQILQVAAIASQEDPAQIDQAVDGFFSGASCRVLGRSDVPPCGGA